MAVLDLDGVVYAGGDAITHAVESLSEARGHGMRLAYVTNNAARTPEAVAEHLTRLGVPAEPGEVITWLRAARGDEPEWCGVMITLSSAQSAAP